MMDTPDYEFIAPGAEGPLGTGIEGADDALIDDAGWGDDAEAPGLDVDALADAVTEAVDIIDGMPESIDDSYDED